MVTESCRECAIPCRVVVMLVNGDLCLNKGDKLINSDHAITINVPSSKESLGLTSGECPCSGAEVLQEELKLILLNEAALVLVNDEEGLLDLLGGLGGETACLEEGLVVEGLSSCAGAEGGLDVSVSEYTSEGHFFYLLRCVEASENQLLGLLDWVRRL